VRTKATITLCGCEFLVLFTRKYISKSVEAESDVDKRLILIRYDIMHDPKRAKDLLLHEIFECVAEVMGVRYTRCYPDRQVRFCMDHTQMNTLLSEVLHSYNGAITSFGC
jgi:hypothetical protein